QFLLGADEALGDVFGLVDALLPHRSLEEEVAVLAFGYRLGGPEDDDLLAPGRHLVFDTTHEHVDGERRHTGQDQCNEQNQCSPTHEVSSPLTRLSELVRRCLPSA